MCSGMLFRRIAWIGPNFKMSPYIISSSWRVCFEIPAARFWNSYTFCRYDCSFKKAAVLLGKLSWIFENCNTLSLPGRPPDSLRHTIQVCTGPPCSQALHDRVLAISAASPCSGETSSLTLTKCFRHIRQARGDPSAIQVSQAVSTLSASMVAPVINLSKMITICNKHLTIIRH